MNAMATIGLKDNQDERNTGQFAHISTGAADEWVACRYNSVCYVSGK